MLGKDLVVAVGLFAGHVVRGLPPSIQRPLIAQVDDAAERIMASQGEYEQDGIQRFERLSLVDLVAYTREESLDLVNYGAMLEIKSGEPGVSKQERDETILAAERVTRLGMELSSQLEDLRELLRRSSDGR